MSKEKLKGICHICGNYGDLTFEHVPPRAAFNNKRTIAVKFEDTFRLGPDTMPKGRTQQGGIGFYTLCAKCNNNTGSWYGKYFIDWCYQGIDVLIRSGGKPSLIYLNYLFPLPIIKQIITMFFSVNPCSFGKVNTELVRFILNKEAKYLPPKYNFFAYYNTSNKFRYQGTCCKGNFFSGKYCLLSEINYPPFGYVMTIDSEPPDDRLFEITNFSRFSYNEFKVMDIKMPVLPIHTAMPGDYRTKEEIYKQISKNSIMGYSK